MEWWQYWLCTIGAFVVVAWLFRKRENQPKKPELADVLKEQATEARMAYQEHMRQRAEEQIVEAKPSLSPEMLECERKKTRAKRVGQIHEHLIEEIKRANLTGSRWLDAEHPCDWLRREERGRYYLYISISESGERTPSPGQAFMFAEDNAVVETVANMLRLDGIGVDTSKMLSDNKESGFDRFKKRMVITW